MAKKSAGRRTKKIKKGLLKKTKKIKKPRPKKRTRIKVAKKQFKKISVRKEIKKDKMRKITLKRSAGRRTKKTESLIGNELVHKTKIRIIGIGGGGGSIISEIAPRVRKVDFVAANTDFQALKGVSKDCRVFQFGQDLTHGLGCGMDSRLALKAALGEKEKIAKLFQGVDLCFFVGSLGGGTASGAAPEFAKIAKDLGVMTVGVFTLPFKFEGAKKTQIARAAIEKLTPNLNAMIIVPNEKIFHLIDKNTPLKEALSAINKILAESLGGLMETIYLPGLINIDFADLKTILEGKGRLAYLNAVFAEGPNRTEEASQKVLKSPLNEYGIRGAERMLFNITASKDLKMREVEKISRAISDFNNRAKIIFGVSQDQKYNDNIRVTLLAVGCCEDNAGKPEAGQDKNNGSNRGTPPEVSSGRGKVLRDKNAANSNPEVKLKTESLKPKQARIKKILSQNKKNKNNPRTVLSGAKVKKSIPKISSEKRVEPEIPANHSQEIYENNYRRNALDLRKDAERLEQEMLAQERQWDVPAFLRRIREK